MPHREGSWKPQSLVFFCKAAEFKLPRRFSEAGTAAQAVLGGKAESLATHGPPALYLGRRRASGTEESLRLY